MVTPAISPGLTRNTGEAPWNSISEPMTSNQTITSKFEGIPISKASSEKPV